MLGVSAPLMLSAERLAAPVPSGAHALLLAHSGRTHGQHSSSSGRAGFRFSQRYAPAPHAAAADRCSSRHIARAVATQQVVETTAATPTSERRSACVAPRRMRRAAAACRPGGREKWLREPRHLPRLPGPRAWLRGGPGRPGRCRTAGLLGPVVATPAAPGPLAVSLPRQLDLHPCPHPPTHTPPPPSTPPPQPSPRTWW
jgi:hypothetical protein